MFDKIIEIIDKIIKLSTKQGLNGHIYALPSRINMFDTHGSYVWGNKKGLKWNRRWEELCKCSDYLYKLEFRDCKLCKALLFKIASTPDGWLRNLLIWNVSWLPLPYLGSLILSFFVAERFAFLVFESDKFDLTTVMPPLLLLKQSNNIFLNPKLKKKNIYEKKWEMITWIVGREKKKKKWSEAALPWFPAKYNSILLLPWSHGDTYLRKHNFNLI